MGVPGLYARLAAQYRNAGFSVRKPQGSNEGIHHLLLDANGIVYQMVAHVTAEFPHLLAHNDLFEHKVIRCFLKYIDALILEAKPSDSVYIAMDGVAPMAKIKHQRLRRFKQVHDERELSALAQQHGIQQAKKWNLSAITPGTIFMHKLTCMTIDWAKQRQDTSLPLRVVFSSPYTPGEGEHKILQYIKRSDGRCMVYGLDADLLFLMLASRRDVVLLRETNQIDCRNAPPNAFNIIYVDRMRQLLAQSVTDVAGNGVISDACIADDLVFLCSMCGNDFVPRVPSLNLKATPNGLDTVVTCYALVLRDLKRALIRLDPQTKRVHVDQAFLVQFLREVADREDDFLSNIDDAIAQQRRRCSQAGMDAYNQAMRRRENLWNVKVDRLGTNPDEWRTAYRKRFAGPLDVPEYLYGLVWIAHYYFFDCPSWDWWFRGHHAPLASDMLAFLEANPSSLDDLCERVHGRDSFRSVIKPLQQLMMVLPLESSFLLPFACRNVVMHPKYRAFFPSELDLDTLHRSKHWECAPILDVLQPRHVLKDFGELVLNDFDRMRNRNLEEFEADRHSKSCCA